jgi:hypothetical protein
MELQNALQAAAARVSAAKQQSKKLTYPDIFAALSENEPQTIIDLVHKNGWDKAKLSPLLSVMYKQGRIAREQYSDKRYPTVRYAYKLKAQQIKPATVVSKQAILTVVPTSFTINIGGKTHKLSEVEALSLHKALTKHFKD